MPNSPLPTPDSIYVEFNLSSPRTVQRFFGTTQEDIWKLLFKAHKPWPEMTEDLGLDCTHPATPVSFLTTSICKSKEYTKLSILPIGLDKEGGADSVSGSAARGTNHPTSDKDAGSGALLGAGKEGQEKGQGDEKWSPPQGASDVTPEDAETHSPTTEDDEEEEESNSPPEGGGRRGRPPQIWRQRRPRGGRAPSQITPRGMSKVAWSECLGSSLGPPRKYKKLYGRPNTRPFHFLILICLNYSIVVRPVTAPRDPQQEVRWIQRRWPACHRRPLTLQRPRVMTRWCPKGPSPTRGGSRDHQGGVQR